MRIVSALALAIGAQPALGDGRAKLYYDVDDSAWPSPGQGSPPEWSNDSSELIFQQTREEGFAQIYAIRPDGSGLRRITDGTYRAGHPHCDPTSDRLAMIGEPPSGRGIYTIRLDGSDLTLILPDPQGVMNFPTFSPDGRRMLYVERVDDAEWTNDLVVLDPASGEQRTIDRDVKGLGWSAWSNDGSRIWFYAILPDGRNQVFRIKSDGSEKTQITTGRNFDAWTPDPFRDGIRLLVNLNATISGDWGNNADVAIMHLESGAFTSLATMPFHEHGSRLSPDETKIAYFARAFGMNEIWVMNIDGSNQRQLTFPPESELTWVIRKRGLDAGVTHYETHRHEGALFGAWAMNDLLEDFASEPAESIEALARIYVETYPESIVARRALMNALGQMGKDNERRVLIDQTIEMDVSDADMALEIGVEQMLALLAERAEEGSLVERQVNALGYGLLGKKMVGEAVRVFEINARAFPVSSNVFDSLGEALLARGDAESARAAYERSLELDPANDNAVRMLESLNRD